MMTANTRILIVENDQETAQEVNNVLTWADYQVLGAVATGEEAIAQIPLLKPDLILMDILLDGVMDGVLTAEFIKKQYHIPIVYLTGYQGKEILERVKATEPYGYIMKPFAIKELISVIEISLYKYHIDQQNHQQEKWLETTLSSIADGVITTDNQGLIQFMNEQAEQLTGWHRQEAINRPLPEVWQVIDQTINSVNTPDTLQNSYGQIFTTQNQRFLLSKQKQKIPIHDQISPIKDEHDQVCGVVIVFRDLFAERYAEEKIQIQEKRFRGIFNHSFSYIWMVRPDGMVIEANQTALELASISDNRNLRYYLWDPLWWNLSLNTQRQLQQAIARCSLGDFVREELTIISADHEILILDISIKPVTDDHGVVNLLVVEGRDITYRHRAEIQLREYNQNLETKVQERTFQLEAAVKQLEAEIAERQVIETQLRASEERFKNLVETTNDFIWEVDENMVYTYASPQVENILGYTPQEILGKTPWDLMPKDEVVKVQELLRNQHKLNYNHIDCLENTNLHKNGNRVVLETNAVYLFDQNGEFRGYRGIDRDVTERKKVEEALFNSQQELQAIIDNSTTVIYAKDITGKYFLANQEFFRLFDITPETLYGKTDMEVFPYYIAEVFQANDQQVLQANIPLFFEEAAELPDGLHTYVAIKFLLYDHAGEPYAICGISTDITERKKAEEKLQQNLTTIESSIDGIGVTDQAGNFVYMNTSHLQIYGYSEASELLGKSWQVLYDEIEEKYLLENILPELHRTGKWQGETVGKKRDGSLIPLEISITLTTDQQTICICRDITERKLAEQALRESEGRLHKIFNSMKDGIIILEQENGHILFVNPATEKLLGRKEAELIQIDLGRFIDVSKPQELEFINQQQEVITVELCLVAMTWDGQPAYLGSLRDISDRLRTEEALRMSEIRLQYLLSSSPAVIYSCKIDGEYGATFMSENVINMMGYPAVWFVKNWSFWLDHVHPEDKSSVLKFIKNNLANDSIGACEYRFKHRDGSYRWVMDQVKLIHNEMGEPAEFVGYWADISDRKIAEEKLKNLLREKEYLLKEIHHRVKNNLQIISSLLKLQSRHIQDPKALAMFKDSRNRVISMALLHERLYRSNDLAQIDAYEYISSLVKHLKNSFGNHQENITITTNIEHIFLNVDIALPCGLIVSELVSNALKYAFPHGQDGNIALSLRQAENMCILEVQDNGIGLPPNMESKKQQSLGLQLVHNLSEQLQGQLLVENNPGVLYRLIFPLKNDSRTA
jgi:PAS domain S-box-containing protein